MFCRVHLLKTRDDFYYPLEIKIGSCIASRHPITRIFVNSFFYFFITSLDFMRFLVIGKYQIRLIGWRLDCNRMPLFMIL